MLCGAVRGAGASGAGANIRPMVHRAERTERTARILSERVDALAAALRAAGVDPAASERLLGSAAAAAMDALALDLIASDAQTAHAPAAPGRAARARPHEQPIQLAA